MIPQADFEKPFGAVERAARADGAEVEMLVERFRVVLGLVSKRTSRQVRFIELALRWPARD